MPKGGTKHHKLDCNCFICKFEREEKFIHKPNCQCASCKAKYGKQFGKDNPNFKGDNAITRKKYFCKQPDCKNEITYQCYFQGSGNCKSCATKIQLKESKNHPMFIDGRSTKKYFCKCGKEITWQTAINGRGMCQGCTGKYLSKALTGQKRPNTSKTLRAMWKDEEFRERRLALMRKGMAISPNKPEKELSKLLNKLFPKEYKINVKGEIMILGDKFPDFVNVNGQKKVVELFGDYFHSDAWIKKHGCYEDTETGRIKHFKKFGWNTLIVWEHELKDKNRLKEKLIEFNNVPN